MVCTIYMTFFFRFFTCMVSTTLVYLELGGIKKHLVNDRVGRSVNTGGTKHT